MANVGGIRRKGKPGPTELTPVVTYILIALNVAVSLAHILTDPGSVIPTVGASGAISGVSGGGSPRRGS